MNTTILFAELLIIGLQVGGWLFLLIFTLAGADFINRLALIDISKWATTIILVLLSFLYTIGILFDRLADIVFSGPEIELRKKYTPYDTGNTTRLRFLLGERYKDFEAQFEYTKSRVRIVRAFTINLVIYLILTMLLIWFRTAHGTEVKQISILLVSTIGLILFFFSYRSWKKLFSTYLGQVRSAYGVYLRNNVQNLNNPLDLEILLEATGNREISRWGKGSTKSINDLWNEILNGESVFQENPFARVVEVVQIVIKNKDYVLIESKQIMKDGRHRERNFLPSEKKKIWESYIEAAKRCLMEEFHVEQEKVKVLESTYRQRQEYKNSVSYPGLRALFRYHVVDVKVTGLPQKDFWTEESQSNEDDPVAKHFWIWKNPKEIRESNVLAM